MVPVCPLSRGSTVTYFTFSVCIYNLIKTSPRCLNYKEVVPDFQFVNILQCHSVWCVNRYQLLPRWVAVSVELVYE